MGTIRNVFRRKARALLTIAGITIGILALVVMGAMAEKLNLLVDGGVRYYGDKVTVIDGGSQGMFGGPLQLDTVDEIEKVAGVKVASANLGMLLDPEQGAALGVPPMIMATDMRQRGVETFVVEYASGREIAADDHGKVALGSDIALSMGAEVGDMVEVRGRTFEVIGIAEKTLTAPDNTVMMTLADAQDIFVEDLPTAVRDQIDPRKLCTSVAVYPTEDTDPEALAATIGEKLPSVRASGPTAFKEQVAGQMKIFNGIIFSVALISLVIGGMSVVNTMTMAVAERTREIGIRKAIGADTGAIVRQFVAESALIGLVGGLTGLGLGALLASGMNAAGEASGTMLFLVTGRLAAGSVTFAVVLGVIAGLYPAIHAARLHPVHALRYE